MGIIKQNSLIYNYTVASVFTFQTLFLTVLQKSNYLGDPRFIKRDSLLYLTLYVIPKKTRQIFIYNFLFPWTPKEFFLVKKFEFRLTSIIFLLSDYFPQLNGERSTHCTFTTCSTIFFLFCSATYIIVCIHRLSHFSTLLIFPSFIKKKTQIFLSNF